MFSGQVTAADLLACVAAVDAHPGYTPRFADELTTPGIRLPLTADPALWAEAMEMGRTIVWVHTYGESQADPDAGRPVRISASDPTTHVACSTWQR